MPLDRHVWVEIIAGSAGFGAYIAIGLALPAPHPNLLLLLAVGLAVALVTQVGATLALEGRLPTRRDLMPRYDWDGRAMAIGLAVMIPAALLLSVLLAPDQSWLASMSAFWAGWMR